MSETLEDIVVSKMETTTPIREKSSAVGNAATYKTMAKARAAIEKSGGLK